MKFTDTLNHRLRGLTADFSADTGKIRTYVDLMMTVMGRGLVAISRFDGPVRREMRGFPVGFRFEMITLPDGPSTRLRVNIGGEFEPDDSAARPDLSIQFKHLRHAFTVLSFREGTVRAFANNRMVVDGDIAYAMRMVRILDRLQSIILPDRVARLAVKRFTPVEDKGRLALKIYGDVLAMSLKGAQP